MTKISLLQFAASLSVDISDEIDDLSEMISAYKSYPDDTKLEKMIKQYNHVSSFLQGVEYMIDFIEDEEDKEELKGIYEKNWIDPLRYFWPSIVECKYTKEIGMEVRIGVTWENGKRVYDLRTGDVDSGLHTENKEIILGFLKALKH